MSMTDFQRATGALDECERTVERLHKMCCEPGRSPRMNSILGDIDTARERLAAANDTQSVQEVIETLEAIGAQIGHLQIGCCTDARMPLYADALRSLTETQIEINRSLGRAH